MWWLYFVDITFIPFGIVEKILKGSLDSIPSPSPSVKIQIMGFKGLLTRSSNVLLLHLKQTFPPTILIFTEGDEIESRLPFKIFSTLSMNVLVLIQYCRVMVGPSQERVEKKLKPNQSPVNSYSKFGQILIFVSLQWKCTLLEISC